MKPGLKPSNLKRGMEVFLASPLNFAYGQERISHLVKDEKGFTMRVPHIIDHYGVEYFTIHSIGEKVMRLRTDEGPRKRAVMIRQGEFDLDGWITGSKEDIVPMIRELAFQDPHSTDELLITYNYVLKIQKKDGKK